MRYAVLRLLSHVREDPSIPTLETIPSVEVLQQHAWNSAYVFRYVPSPRHLPVISSAESHLQAAMRGNQDFGLLAPVTEQGWPNSLQQWRLCNVSCIDLQCERLCTNQGADAVSVIADACYRMAAHASRWEVVGTILAIERYHLLAVPVPSEEMAARSTGDELNSCSVLQPMQLTNRQLQQARVLVTLCRVISSAGGAPPTPEVAAKSMAMSVDDVFAHSFFNTAIPLLGVTAHSREESWNKTLRSSSDSGLSVRSSTQGSSSGLTSATYVSQGSSVSRDNSVRVGRQSLLSCGSLTTASAHFTQSACLTNSPIEMIDTASSTPGSELRTKRALCGGVPSPRPDFIVGRSAQVQWQASVLPCLFESTCYGDAVTRGWEKWGKECSGGLCRALIVNSMDDIVHFCRSSRNAFYTAVAFLDRFVAVVANPKASCQSFHEEIHRRHHHSDDRGIHIDARAVCTYFTQVIAACAMLGCKTTDVYSPSVNQILRCLQSDAQVSRDEFALLEVHVLKALRFELTVTTVNDTVEALLHMCGGDGLQDAAECLHYKEQLSTIYGGNADMRSQIDKRFNQHRYCQRTTPVSKQDIDKWEHFSSVVRCVCDIVIRGRKNGAGSSRGGPSLQLLEVPPVLLGFVILLFSADMECIELPKPIVSLLFASNCAQLEKRKFSTAFGAGNAPQLRSKSAMPVMVGDDTFALLQQFAELFSTWIGKSTYRADGTCTETSEVPLRWASSGVNDDSGVSAEASDARYSIQDVLNEVQELYSVCLPPDSVLCQRYPELFKREGDLRGCGKSVRAD